MWKCRLCLLGFLLAAGSAAAQRPDDEYYPYAVEQEQEPQPLLLTDSTIFYRAVQSLGDLYGSITDYNLSFVASSRRGQRRGEYPVVLNGVPLRWGIATPLRALGLAGERAAESAGLPPGLSEGSEGTAFRFAGDELRPFHRASVTLSGRNYLVRGRMALAEQLGCGWSVAAAADGRTGRDLVVDGVFTNALAFTGGVVKRFGEGHELSLLLSVQPSERGTRSSSVEEAFTLLDNPSYNPAWGFQNGKVRNSRVRRELVPVAVLSYGLPLGRTTRLDAVFGIEAGVQRYSTLGWYDARTPMPDNYRYLPGYTGDREIETAWRTNDTRYTQVAWDELYAINRMAGSEAHYALEDRAERLCNLHFDLRFESWLSERLCLTYGASVRRADIRSYKQMRDLLGADRLIDIDQYLIDDDAYGNKLQNDLRNPNRVIRKGDRFGYDYNLTTTDLRLWAAADYRADRFRCMAAAEIGEASVRRRGNYEKELFPGVESYGLSRKIRFTPYAFRAGAGWAFSPRSYLGAEVRASALLPEADALFFQPQYNNRIVDKPAPQRELAAELNFNRTGRKLTLRLTAFVWRTSGEIDTRRYFDDLSGTFADMTVSGITRQGYGVEAAAEIRLSYRLRLSVAATAGSYAYAADPRVTILADADNTLIDNGSVSYMNGRRMGGAPQFSGVCELVWFGPKGWGFRAGVNYAGGRFLDPTPLRRTERVARAAASPEAFDRFVGQERLGDAFTLDAAVWKSFRIGESRLTASLTLGNLLNDRTIRYGGYESLRIRRLRSGDLISYEPHASRYSATYPRSFYLSISYKF